MKRLGLHKMNLLIGVFLILVMVIAVGFSLKIHQTPKGVIISQEEFINYSRADIMISNISYFRAEEIARDIRKLEGVYSLKFDNSPNHYRETSVLFAVHFTGEDDDKLTINALDNIKDILRPYDVTIFSSVGDNNDILADRDSIDSLFGQARTLELIIPRGDYESEIELIESLSRYNEIDNIFALSNIRTKKEFILTEAINPTVFADLMDLDYEVSKSLYSTYAVKVDEGERLISGISNYRVSYINMIEFLYNEVKEGYIRLDREYVEKLGNYNYKINRLKTQLESDNYSRIFINLKPLSDETIEHFAGRIFNEANLYYNLDSVFLIGEEGLSYEKN